MSRGRSQVREQTWRRDSSMTGVHNNNGGGGSMRRRPQFTTERLDLILANLRRSEMGHGDVTYSRDACQPQQQQQQQHGTGKHVCFIATTSSRLINNNAKRPRCSSPRMQLESCDTICCSLHTRYAVSFLTMLCIAVCRIL